MTTHRFLLGAFLSFFALLGTSAVAAQHNVPSTRAGFSANGTPVHMLVTVRQHHGHGDETPDIRRRDVQVHEGSELRPVTEWIPAQGKQAGGLELLLLLDDSSRFILGGQLGVLRSFIDGQPPTTSIGVGYMHNGTAEMAQNFTANHAAAAKSLRLPLASTVGAASPYLSITDALKRWPVNPDHPRREILMMSDGIDPNGGGALNPYVNEAIENAQRAGVAVYSIYTPGAERNGQRLNLANWGKSYLAMISEQSGGEAFYLGYGSAVSFAPYLDNLTRDLNHQYLLTFLAEPLTKEGFQKVKVTTEIHNARLIAPDKVYVPVVSQ